MASKTLLGMWNFCLDQRYIRLRYSTRILLSTACTGLVLSMPDSVPNPSLYFVSLIF